MRPAKRSVVVVLSPILIISLWLAGCGPTNGLPPLTGEFLYISNEGDGTISEFSINTVTGALTSIGTFNSTAPANDLFEMAVHPTNEFIYAADDANDVLGFDIGDQSFSGLIFLRNSDTPAVNTPLAVAITPNGKFLYATNSLASKVSEYSVNLSTGALTGIGTAPSGSGPLGVTVESSGQFAYAVNVNDRSASEYFLQPLGTLAANGTLVLSAAAISEPVEIATALLSAVIPSPACAYVSDTGLFALHEMEINAPTGTLTYLGNVPAMGIPDGIAVYPNGNFIYTANSFSDSISVFTQVSSPSPAQGAPPCTVVLTSQISVPQDSAPVSIAIEPMGKFAYTANFLSGTVGEFSIDSTTGALTSIGVVNSETPLNLGSGPKSAVTTH